MVYPKPLFLFAVNSACASNDDCTGSEVCANPSDDPNSDAMCGM